MSSGFKLLIDTSTKSCNLVLLHNQTIHIQQQQVINGDNKILTIIQLTLANLSLELSNCIAIGYVDGPGSFTGLRVGAAVVQAISYSLQIPVIKLSRLQLLSQQAYEANNIFRCYVGLDALRDEVYWGNYQYNSEQQIMLPIEPDTLKSGISWEKVSSNVSIISDLPINNQNLLAIDKLTDYQIAIAKLFEYHYAHQHFTLARQALPNYFKLPHLQ